MSSPASRFRSRRWLVLYALHLIIVAVLVRVVFFSPSEESLPPFHEMYTGEQIAYFRELALGCDPDSEELTGVKCNSDYVTKWRGPIRVGVAGQPSRSDLSGIDQVIDQLRVLIWPADIYRDDPDPNLTIHLIPGDQFGRISSHFPSGRGGSLTFQDSPGNLVAADVVVDSTENERIRRNVILKGLTHALGLSSASWAYRYSVFYQGHWIDETRDSEGRLKAARGPSAMLEFTEIDKAVIRLLYDPRIKPGMDDEDLQRIGMYPLPPTRLRSLN